MFIFHCQKIGDRNRHGLYQFSLPGTRLLHHLAVQRQQVGVQLFGLDMQGNLDIPIEFERGGGDDLLLEVVSTWIEADESTVSFNSSIMRVEKVCTSSAIC